MLTPEIDGLTEYAAGVLFDAQRVIEELDPLTNGSFPEVVSVLSWLMPLAEESRAWTTSLGDVSEFLDDNSDSFTPVVAMKLVLDLYESIRKQG